MKLVNKILKKMLILVAAPWLWLWTHYYFAPVRSRSKSKIKKSLTSGMLKSSRFPIPALLIVILFSIPGSAQQYIDLVRINANYTSLNSFKDSKITSVISEIDLDLTLPVVLNEKLTLVTGLMGETFKVDLDVNDFSKSFYLIGPKIGVNIKHSEKWSGTYIFLPKIASDYSEISGKDLQLGGYVLFKYNKQPNMNYKFGVYANNEFFGPWVVPLFGIYFLNRSEKFEMNLTLPFLADFNYRISKTFAVGMNFNGMTKSYNINQPVIQDSPGYLTRATNELYLYGSFSLTNNIIVQLKGGHSFGRYYRVYEENDRVSLGMPLQFFNDKRNQLNSDFEDGWVFQVMAFYRLPIVSK